MRYLLLGALFLLALLLLYRSSPQAPEPSLESEVEAPTPELPTSEEALKSPSVDAAPPMEVQLPEDLGLPKDAAPQGPFLVPLGAHSLHLKGGEEILDLELSLRVAQARTQKEVHRRRRQLLRMMLFLGTHRVPEGIESPEGRARLKKDLEERFGNVLRSGPLLGVEFSKYQLRSRN